MRPAINAIFCAVRRPPLALSAPRRHSAALDGLQRIPQQPACPAAGWSSAACLGSDETGVSPRISRTLTKSWSPSSPSPLSSQCSDENARFALSSWPGVTRGPSAHGLDPRASTGFWYAPRQLAWMRGTRPGMDERLRSLGCIICLSHSTNSQAAFDTLPMSVVFHPPTVAPASTSRRHIRSSSNNIGTQERKSIVGRTATTTGSRTIVSSIRKCRAANGVSRSLLAAAAWLSLVAGTKRGR